MKTFRKHLFLLLTLLGIAVYDAKADVVGEGWTFDTNEKELVIDKSIEYSDAISYPWHRYRDQIESVVIKGGTVIGDYAFIACSKLSSIYISKEVTSIGSLAFANCGSIISIRVAQGNTVYDSRNYCDAIIETSSNTLIRGCNTTIIPIDITSIVKSAFSYCSLTSITIPEGVTSIGEGVFYNCTGELIVNCNIPNSAFRGSDFTEVTIGENVTSIGGGAFYNCI